MYCNGGNKGSAFEKKIDDIYIYIVSFLLMHYLEGTCVSKLALPREKFRCKLCNKGTEVNTKNFMNSYETLPKVFELKRRDLSK